MSRFSEAGQGNRTPLYSSDTRLVHSSTAPRGALLLKAEGVPAVDPAGDMAFILAGAFLRDGKLLPEGSGGGSWFHVRLFHYDSTSLGYSVGQWPLTGGAVLFAVNETRWASSMVASPSDIASEQRGEDMDPRNLMALVAYQAPAGADAVAFAMGAFGEVVGNDIRISFEDGVGLLNRYTTEAQAAYVLGSTPEVSFSYAFRYSHSSTSRAPDGVHNVDWRDDRGMEVAPSHTHLFRNVTLGFDTVSEEKGWSELSFRFGDNEIGKWGFGLDIDGKPREHEDDIPGQESIDPHFYSGRPLGFQASGRIWLELTLSQQYPEAANVTQLPDYNLEFYSLATGLDIASISGLAMVPVEGFM